MSEPLRIALVAEGPTDAIVIKSAVRSILGERSFVHLGERRHEYHAAIPPTGDARAGRS